MALSYTYLQMQTQIIDDLGDRADLLAPLLTSAAASSPVKRAIQSAIAKWERTRFYFNEAYQPSFFTTVAGQEFYTSVDTTNISTVVDIVSLRMTRFALVRRRWEYLDAIATSGTAMAPPESFAYFAEQIRLYPIPDSAYLMAGSVVKRLTALSADSDTNAWTQDGFDLIRAEALAIIAVEYLHDEALAMAMERAIYGNPAQPNARGYLAALQGEGESRTRPRTLRAAGNG